MEPHHLEPYSKHSGPVATAAVRVASAGVEIFTVTIRYGGAMIVALAVSMLVAQIAVAVFDIGMMRFLSGANDIGVTVQTPFGSTTIMGAAAFAGVFAGSLCLGERSRELACVALTFLGTMAYWFFWYTDWRHQTFSKHGHSFLVVPLIAGGLGALVLTRIISRRQSDRDGANALAEK